MNNSRSKLVAIITGTISIFICIIYLLLITVFDFRTFLNNHITILSGNIEIIFFEMDKLFLFLIY